MHFAHEIVRRGFEASATVFAASGGEKKTYQLPGWGIFTLTITGLFYFGIMFMIEYTFGRLIPTLLMIESPQEGIAFEPIPTEDEDPTNKNLAPELQALKIRPITDSFCTSIKHLQAIGGFRARFRGVSVFFVNAIAIQWITGILSVLPIINLLGRGFSSILGAVVCAQLSLAWTHIVISTPSSKPWYRRMPTLKMWKQVAGPTAILALAEQVAVMVPVYIAIASGVTRTPEELQGMTPHQKSMMLLGGSGFAIMGLILGFVLVIPANVVLTRVQASLLADSEETIVPFDRSFSGKVVPEIVGGSGAIGMLDAWKSFDWAARVRLVKAYVKVFAMQMGVSILFTILFLLQLFLMVGNDFSKLLPGDGEKSGL